MNKVEYSTISKAIWAIERWHAADTMLDSASKLGIDQELFSQLKKVFDEECLVATQKLDEIPAIGDPELCSCRLGIGANRVIPAGKSLLHEIIVDYARFGKTPAEVDEITYEMELASAMSPSYDMSADLAKNKAKNRIIAEFKKYLDWCTYQSLP
jgi:hypothetical protein